MHMRGWRIGRAVQQAALSAAAFCAVAADLAPLAAAQDSAPAPLAAFDRLAGKTWRGVAPEDAGKIDIIRWQRIMGGKAVQSIHSINDGEYGGQTIFFYSPNEEKLLFHYFTTANFHSTGEIVIEESGNMVITEQIHGIDNLPEARARLVFHDDGWEMKSLYLKDGVWTEGDGFRYREAPHAEVLFRNARP